MNEQPPKTIFHGPPAEKPFAWSFSKLNNFETCPKRHYDVDVAKRFKEEDGAGRTWGFAVHDAAAKRIRDLVPPPPGMEAVEPWAVSVLTNPGIVRVEQKLAISKNFVPCDWFSRETWLRVVIDVLKINGRVALALDWKTGKIVEDSVQLAVTAAVIFAHYPEVEVVRSEFIWLKENASTPAYFRRDEMAPMWRSLWPRLEALEHAYKTSTFPAVAGRLCARFCPVADCPHHGKRY